MYVYIYMYMGFWSFIRGGSREWGVSRFGVAIVRIIEVWVYIGVPYLWKSFGILHYFGGHAILGSSDFGLVDWAQCLGSSLCFSTLHNARDPLALRYVVG